MTGPKITYHHPEPPVNVRLVFGREAPIPVDCTYGGLNRIEGVHVWVAANPRPTILPDQILIDALPPHTEVTVGGGPIRGK